MPATAVMRAAGKPAFPKQSSGIIRLEADMVDPVENLDRRRLATEVFARS
jgi:hypothetical protein